MKGTIIFVVIAAIVIGLIISIIILSMSKLKYPNGSNVQTSERYRTANQYFYKRRNVWLYTALGLSIANYWTIVLSFFFTLCVIYITLAEYSTEQIVLFSVLSLICSLFGYVQHPKEKALAYRSAFRKIDYAINNYEFSPNPRPEAEMVEAINSGEEDIHQSQERY